MKSASVFCSSVLITLQHLFSPAGSEILVKTSRGRRNCCLWLWMSSQILSIWSSVQLSHKTTSVKHPSGCSGLFPFRHRSEQMKIQSNGEHLCLYILNHNQVSDPEVSFLPVGSRYIFPVSVIFFHSCRMTPNSNCKCNEWTVLFRLVLSSLKKQWMLAYSVLKAHLQCVSSASLSFSWLFSLKNSKSFFRATSPLDENVWRNL